MNTLTITADTRQLTQLLQLAGTANGSPRMRQALAGGLRKAMAQVESVHKRQVIARGQGKNLPRVDVWSWRTGEAGRSFHRVIDARALEGAYGSNLARVGVLEMGTQAALGGPLKPRNGKYLAIPTNDARVGVGRALSPRDRTDLVFVVSRKGNPVLLEKGTGRLMYALKESVTIEPRPTLEMTQVKAQPLVDAAMAEAVDAGLSGGGASG